MFLPFSELLARSCYLLIIIGGHKSESRSRFVKALMATPHIDRCFMNFVNFPVVSTLYVSFEMNVTSTGRTPKFISVALLLRTTAGWQYRYSYRGFHKSFQYPADFLYFYLLFHFYCGVPRRFMALLL